MSPKCKPTKNAQLRRNERERKRVHQVNDGFDRLRCRVPKAVTNKKLSKADTLREAVKYIQYLQTMLTNDYTSSSNAFNSLCQSPRISPEHVDDVSSSEHYYSESNELFFPSSNLSNLSKISPMSFNYPLNYSCSSVASTLSASTSSLDNASSVATVSVTSSPESYSPNQSGNNSITTQSLPVFYQYQMLPSGM